jgi:hypothetical protein
MRQGKRERVIRVISSASRIISYNLKSPAYAGDFSDWVGIYFVLSNIFYLRDDYGAYPHTFEYYIQSGEEPDTFSLLDRFVTDSSGFVKSFLLKILSQVSPVFSYFIYSVDKNIRKFSRGKSGKYTFL